MIVGMPLMQLLILPLAADYEIKNINISIVDHDRSSLSRELTARIIASGYFIMNDYGDSFTESFQQFQKDNSDLILEIPGHFERDLVKDQKGNLFIAVNAINGTKASVGSAYLSQIISTFNYDIHFKRMPSQRIGAMPAVEITSLNWFNPYLNYPFFMVPGLLVALVTIVGSIMCALNIVVEKEVGTIEQINVTPIGKFTFILGKLIPFWFIGIFIFSLGLFVVARGVYGIVPVGSLWVLYGFLSVYLIAILGFGLLMSTYSSTQQQAMSLSFFFIMIFLLMSGLFTAIESMPPWAQWVARFNPVTSFIEVMRMVVLKGSGFADIKKQLLTVSGMAVFFNTWAILNYRKRS